MKRTWSIILVVALCMSLMSACSGGKAVGNKKDVKIFMTISQSDTFRKLLVDAAKKTAESEGAKLDSADAGGSVEKQVEQIKNAVKEGYNVILCNPVNVDMALELEADAGDLPIVFINSCPDDSRLKAGKYIYAGSDEKYAGQYQAEYILDKFKDKSEINVVIVKGQQNHPATVGRTDAFMNTLMASGKTIHYVFNDYANWDQKTAQKLFDVFLTTGQDFDCVACNNDSMALGVIDACKEKKVNMSGKMILGIDATAEGCAAIEKGDMAFTVYQSASGQGENSVKAAIALATGAKTTDMKYSSKDGKYLSVPFEKVDKDNVKNYK
jgi:inositol transport system substrate-binding protein